MPPIWITAHTTQFAKPGWRYVDSAARRLPGGGSVVTLRSPGGNDHSSIFETQRTAGGEIPTRAQTVRVTGLRASGSVHVWKSTATEQFVRQPDIPVSGGAYQITLEPDAVYTVTTTTGQRKGDAAGPATAPFPHTYRDDFESGRRGQQPRYLAQMAGSFELVPCKGGRRGQCAEQVVGQRAVEWFKAYPTSFLGDSAGWTDVEVQTAFLHDREGAAEVWARIGNNGVDSTDIAIPALPDGYYLSVEKSGRWYLGKTVDGQRRQLRAGHAEMRANAWHTMRISVRGTTINAFLDGKQVGTATDATYGHGRAGIGTGWNRVQFDDFAVTPK
jgi:hypothetical protein